MVSKASPATKSTVAGLAAASAVFGLADVFFSPEAQMLQHPNYVIGIVTWLPLLCALWPFYRKLAGARIQFMVLGMLLVIGVWEAYSSFRIMRPVNTFQSHAVSELQQLQLSERDLIIAPSRFSDDISSWIPLLSSARVLFTDDSENILSATDTRTLHTTRQALYLEFFRNESGIARRPNSRRELGCGNSLITATNGTYARRVATNGRPREGAAFAEGSFRPDIPAASE